MKAIKGWYFDKTLGVYRVPIRIINPQNNHSIIKFCLFDTGFSGYLGLDKDAISSLGLPKIGRGKGVTAKGIIDYDNYEGVLEIVDENEKSLVKIQNVDKDIKAQEKTKIPIQEFDIPIVGIKSIRQFSWLILSTKDALYLIE